MWLVGCRGLAALVVLLLAGVMAEPKGVLEHEAVIGVSNGGTWGSWGWQEMCPEDTYATGFSLKVESYQGEMKDDTALNGIRLFCTRGGHGDKREAHIVESQSGPWGHWLQPIWCPEGTYLVRFSLRVEQNRPGIQDVMGATNVRFACSGGATLEGNGLSWGEYGGWSPSCKRVLCGIQTKQEPVRGALRDDTALNDVRFYCCNH
ncbi:vitelline membrane outer layer protein 1 homolog [Rhineura floridana]|uniref:vitelline membrane outer layer protein 1 homolog n=1 Tax=Rhineura floridana TaxID=261503 RepID=UPI002AC83CFD|nr:vitelline membrane outer layer protein 1 homolog [Rhineura floridana]